MKIHNQNYTGEINAIEMARNDFFGLGAKYNILPNAELISEQRFTLCSLGIDEAVFNGVWCHGNHSFTPKDKVAISTFFTKKNLPFFWWEAPISTDEYNDKMAVSQSITTKKEGMHFLGNLTGMHCNLEKVSEPLLLQGIQIKQIEIEKSLQIFCDLIISEFGLQPKIKYQFETVMKAFSASGNALHFLAYEGQTPISGITLILGSKVASIWNEPQNLLGYDQTGTSAALIQTAMYEAKKRGYLESATILMSDNLVKAWQKLGFEAVCHFPCYTNCEF